MNNIVTVGNINENYDENIEKNNEVYLDVGICSKYILKIIIIGNCVFEGREIDKNIEKITAQIKLEITNACEIYSPVWVTDAILNAIKHSGKSWQYIQKTLENWKTDGRNNGSGFKNALG